MVFGAIVGTLFAFGFIPFIGIAVWISLGLAILFLLILVAGIFLASSERCSAVARCVPTNAICLLAGIIGTIILSLAALSIFLIPIFISVIILLALGAAFFAFMVISLISFISCIACELTVRR